MAGFLFITPPVVKVEKAEKSINLSGNHLPYLVCPDYFYNRDHYPSFLSGTGYIMPRWTLKCLYEEALRLPYFFIEDVFMAGFVADRCNIRKKHYPGFVPGRKEALEINPAEDILIHYMDHEHKFDVHKIVTSKKG